MIILQSSLSQLEDINNALHNVAENTTPITSLSEYGLLTNGKIAIVTLLVGIIAAVFSFLGWRAQRRSNALLRQRNNRKPSLLPLVKKIYDNNILINLIFEYDSEYEMSFTAEEKVSDDKKPSNQKHLFYNLYNATDILHDMALPEDVIMLDKFEIYPNDEVYKMAFCIRGDIQQYNRYLAQIRDRVAETANDKLILSNRDMLFSLGRKIAQEIFSLDEDTTFTKQTQLPNIKRGGNKSPLEKDIAKYIISEFFNSIKFLTPEYILEDPYIISPSQVIDFNEFVSVEDLMEEQERLSKILSQKSCKNPEYKMYLSKLSSAIKCIELVKNRDKYERDPLRSIVEDCLGDIYDDVCRQTDENRFDVNAFSLYYSKLKMATMKHNLLLSGEKRNYDGEYRRITRKSLWNKKKTQLLLK